MIELLAGVSLKYDIIIINASPLLRVVDGRALLNLTDNVLLMVEWNKTSRYAVLEALHLIYAWKDRILGVVMNKVDVKRSRHYDDYDVKAYAGKHPEYYGQGA